MPLTERKRGSRDQSGNWASSQCWVQTGAVGFLQRVVHGPDRALKVRGEYPHGHLRVLGLVARMSSRRLLVQLRCAERSSATVRILHLTRWGRLLICRTW